MTVNGVSLDLPQLELTITNREAQSYFGEVRNCFRYGDFRRAQQNIDKVASDPNLTDEQKAAVAKVADQIKQIAAAAPSGTR